MSRSYHRSTCVWCWAPYLAAGSDESRGLYCCDTHRLKAKEFRRKARTADPKLCERPELEAHDVPGPMMSCGRAAWKCPAGHFHDLPELRKDAGATDEARRSTPSTDVRDSVA